MKYIEPKTFNFIGKDKKHIGSIADDFIASKMPEEWDSVIETGRDGYLRMDYSKTVCVLWGAVQIL